MHPVIRGAVALGALGAACVAYGVAIERRWYRFRRVRVPGVLRAPGVLRILHISDVHLMLGQDHRVAFLEGLATGDHDLVVATGDLLGGVGTEELAATTLGALTTRDRPGVVVLGSNDLYGPVFKSPLAYFTAPSHRAPGPRLDTDRLIELLDGHGYTTLRSGTTTLDTPAGTVVAAGFDDPHLPTTVIPDPATLTAPPDVDAVLHLGVVHAPYLAALDVLVDAGHDLLLSGHTHGGQVRLPGIGALVANCDLPLDQTRGVSRHRDRWLHVSPGLGHSRYAPFRFACRPEATLLELTS